MRYELVLLAFAIATTVIAQPLDVALVLETTLGTEDAIAQVQARRFAEDDRVAVVGVSTTVEILMPLSADKNDLSVALQKAGIRLGATIGDGGTKAKLAVRVADGIDRARQELIEGDDRKRAMIILFSNDDPTLPRRYSALANLVRASHIQVYAVLVQQRPPTNTPSRKQIELYSGPFATTEALRHLANDSGGRLYTGGWDLGDILKAARH